MILKYKKIFVPFQTIKMELSIKDTSISCTLLSNQLNLTTQVPKVRIKYSRLLEEAAVTVAQQATNLFQRLETAAMWEDLFPLHLETENPVPLKFIK